MSTSPINKIWTFGCSFSTDHYMSMSETYTGVLSEKLGVEYENHAESAMCHEECFNRLTYNMNRFNKDDLIIYQFTAGTREGFKINNDFYYTSAGLTRDLNLMFDLMNKYSGGRDKFPITNEQFILLCDYMNHWAPHTIYHKYHRVFNTLSFLQSKIGIKYRILCLDNDFKAFRTEHFINLPTTSDENNLSIMNWVDENKWTLGDTKSDQVMKTDKHPNEEGHYNIGIRLYESNIC